MITIKVDNEVLNQIKKDYQKYITDKNIGYILFTAKKDDEIITAYTNKKNISFKVTIQCSDADRCLKIAEKYSKMPLVLSKKDRPTNDSPYFIDIDEQIGSDEVGTGDFLGPVVVCAAYTDHKTMKIIDELGIQDSKKLSDKQILDTVPLFIKKVYYEYKILSNERYNAAVQKGYNMNRIKAILHNACLSALKKKFPCVNNIYIDQFVEEKLYYSYIKEQPTITKNCIFKTKGESYFPSVALASCIARYLFLKEIEFLSEKYNVKFALGAGKPADESAQNIIKKLGFEEFSKHCKQNFKNFEEIKKMELF